MKFLKIPTPCHEDWNKMTSNEKGRFCQKCDKSVHDFTNKSDQEISNTLKKAKGNVCGHVKSSQLNRAIIANNPVSQNKSLALGILAVVGGVSVMTTPIQTTEHQNPKTEILIKQFMLNGTVLDAYSQTQIPYVNLIIYKNDVIYRALMTDNKGNFSIKLQENNLDNITLEFTHNDYQKDTYQPVNFEQPLKFNLKPVHDFEMVGEIIALDKIETPAPTIQDTVIVDGVINEVEINVNDFKSELKGIVTDSQGEPLPFASLSLLRNDSIINSTQTDINGSFQFFENIQEGDQLKTYYVGFYNTTVNLKPNQSEVEIKMNQGQITTCRLGMISIVELVDSMVLDNPILEEPQTENLKAENQIPTLEITTFPNPATDLLNVQVSSTINGTVDIFDLTGKQVYSTKINGDQLKIGVDQFVIGHYIVRVSDIDNKLHVSERIIVE